MRRSKTTLPLTPQQAIADFLKPPAVTRFWRLVEDSETLRAGDEYLEDGKTWRLWPADYCDKFHNPVGRITRRIVLIPPTLTALTRP